jgi:hypothetical protein
MIFVHISPLLLVQRNCMCPQMNNRSGRSLRCGELISPWLYKRKQATGLKKYIYITPLSSTDLWLRCSNFFNPFKKNSFGCSANRKIGNRKSQNLSSPLRTNSNLRYDLLFAPKRDKVVGGWRKLHNEGLHNLFSSPSIIRIIKSRRMGWAGHLERKGRKAMHITFWWEIRRDH